ncbi:MAG: hypothetical protein ABIL25_05600 [candidate division WOR-3 bacterium]
MRKTLLVLGIASAIGALVTTGCSNKYVQNTLKAVGEEAAYAAIKSALVSAGVKSADHMVDAVRLVADKQDYGGAAAAFAIALEEHNVAAANKLTSSQVVAAMRLAEPAVRKSSPKVANALVGFCDYVGTH